MNRNIALIAAISAGIINGFPYYFVRMFMDGPTPDTIIYLGARSMAAFLAMSAFILAGKFKVCYRNRPGLGLLILCTFLNPILGQTLEVTAVSYASTSQTAVFISIIPLVVIIFSVLINHEAPTRKQLLFLLLTVGGVLLVKLLGADHDSRGSLIGFILILFTCLFIGLYRTLVRRLTAEFSSFEIVYLSTVTGTICFNAYAMIRDRSVSVCFRYLADPGCVIAILFNGVIVFAFVFIIMTYASGHLPVAIAQSINLIYLPVTILVGVFLLDEPFTVVDVIGSALVLVGVIGSTLCYDPNNTSQNLYSGKK